MEQESRRLERTRSQLGARGHGEHAVRLSRAQRRQIRVGLDQRLRGPVDALYRARHEVAAIGREIQRLARLHVSRVRDDRAVAEELQAAVQTASHREMSLEKISGPAIADGDTEAITEVILRV